MISVNENETADTAVRLDDIGKRILSASRDELYLGMRFLDVALSSFAYQMDTTVSPFGTDGAVMYFHPRLLGGMYRQNRILVNRGYLHMVYHCIFRHMMKDIGEQEQRLWDLSCDIAAERMTDSSFHRSVRFSKSLRRREVYRRLEADTAGKSLHAERIFSALKKWDLPEEEWIRVEQEFYVDDHRYWADRQPDRKPDPSLQKKWEEISESMETDMETFSKEAAEKEGELLGQLKIANRRHQDYGEFLRKFSVWREEQQIDADAFDYGLYSYGLSLYGNMPLIEPPETKETKKIEEFVIVIDTSMSCSGETVRYFLEETYGILSQNENYFKKINVHIIQCDEKVQSDRKITNETELKEYMENLTLYGEGGTDFRPAFAYVDELNRNGEFESLRGLLYFTDGYGIYPRKMPAYQTAFVFPEEDYNEEEVPSWAIRVLLPSER